MHFREFIVRIHVQKRYFEMKDANTRFELLSEAEKTSINEAIRESSAASVSIDTLLAEMEKFKYASFDMNEIRPHFEQLHAFDFRGYQNKLSIEMHNGEDFELPETISITPTVNIPSSLAFECNGRKNHCKDRSRWLWTAVPARSI